MAGRTFPVVAAEVAFSFDPGAVQLAYQQEVLKDLPVAYWRLRDAAGPFAGLSLYTEPAAPITGGVTPANLAGPITGEGGNAPLFNGTSGQLTVPTFAPIDTLSNPYAWTFEAWMRPNLSPGTGYRTVVTREYVVANTSVPGSICFGNPSAFGTGLVNTNDCLVMGFYNGTWRLVTDGVALALNTWYHVAVTWDGTTIRAYKNGAMIASAAPGSAVIPTTGFRTMIGVDWTNGVNWFPGHIAEVAIYPSALSADRLAKHYAARLRANPAADLASLPWCNVTTRVRQIGTSRGRQHELNKMETGTGTVRFDNTDRALEPEYAGFIKNRVTNPSFEIDASGWSPDGTVLPIARATTVPFIGGANGLCQTTAAPTSGYLRAQTTVLSAGVIGDKWYASAYVKASTGTLGKTLLLRPWDGVGLTTASVVLTSSYQRVSVPVTIANTNAVQLFIGIEGGAVAGDQFDFDAVMFEPGTVLSAYYDADQGGGRWGGARHASVSYFGGPYYPNVIPMRRTRVRTAWPPQMIPNGSFERSTSDIAPWINTTLGGASTFANVAGDALTTAGLARRIEFTSPAGAAGDQAAIQSDYVPIDASKPYSLSAYFYKTGAGDPYTIMRVLCFDDAKNYLGTCVTPATAGDGSFSLATQAVWQKVGGVIGGVSSVLNTYSWIKGTTYAKVEIYAFYNPARAYTGTVRIDDVALTPGTVMFPDVSYYMIGDYDANDAWQERYNGYAESWDLGWTQRRGTIDVKLVDGFEPAAVENIAVDMPSHLSGTRIKFTADAFGWPRSERSIQAGQSLVQASGFSNNLTQPLTHLLDIGETEQGVTFIGRDGQLTFQDRNDRITGGGNSLSKATFGDGGPNAGELPYVGVTPNYGIEQVYNYVSVTRIGGAQQVAEDAASQLQYWKRELGRSGTWHTTDTDASSVAGFLLAKYKQPALRFDAIKVDPTRDPATWPAVLRRELSNRITVVRRPQAAAVGLIRAVHIEHISDTITLGDNTHWETEFQLSPADTNSYWLMDTSALDTGTRLAL